MKTIKLTVATVLFAVALTTTAVERPRVDLVSVNAGQAVLSIENENAAYFELEIYSAEGDMVYYKRTSELLNDYNRIYDFNNLADGKYVLSLRVNDTRVINDFELSGSDIIVGQQKIKYDPYLNFVNNELKLSYLNFDQDNLKLSIYGKEGLVYEKLLGKEFNLVKGLNLSGLEKGDYRIVLESFDKVFSYNIVR